LKITVRSADGGELEYESFGQVEQAWLMGLVGPDDELLEEGKTAWRKARTYPLLMAARRSGEQVWMGAWFLWTLLGVIGATVALRMLALDALEWKLGGVILGFGVAMAMLKVTMTAHARRKPHR
jgi:hypothetical protein